MLVRLLSRSATVAHRQFSCRVVTRVSISIQPCSQLLQSRRSFASILPRSPLTSSTPQHHPLSTPSPEPAHTPRTSYNDLPIVSMDESKVSIGWDTKTWSRFHHIWLRDHCRCQKCFHPVTMQRLLNTFEIPPGLKPDSVESKPEGLEAIWPGAEPHLSLYPWSWLQRSSYDPPRKRDESVNEKVLWGSKIQPSPPTIAYDEVMAKDDSGVFKWLSNVDKFGFSFISDMPATPEATEGLANQVAFIRETQYGKFWDFTSDLAKGDTAYTNLALAAHTDNTYYTDPCGLQLFHLLSHTDGSGGATLLVDGFYVASILKELHPEHYALLSRVPIPAHAAGEPGCLYRPKPTCGYPVLSHDPVSGELNHVRWNNDDRSVMTGLEPSQVEPWYQAIRTWDKLLKSPDSEYWVQLTPGTAVLVDNHRVLHGRSAFDGKRRMCGAYIGVDEYRSRLTVLGERFNDDPLAREPGEAKRSIWDSTL